MSAALQRRVWYRTLDADPLFCNLYFVLIGPPACGKGLALSQLKRVLFQPKDAAEADKASKSGAKVRTILNAGPDDGSHQGLMDAMSKCTSALRLHDGKRERIYSHASIALVLSEMNSLFKRNQDAVSKFLLKTYDCEDYNYTIVSRCQELLIKNTCLSMIAGCTSHMLEEAARYGIFDSGFISRCVFMFEPSPRYYTMNLPEMTEEQVASVDECGQWIRKLSGLHGKLKDGAGVTEYLASLDPAYERKVKTSTHKMQLYYGRNGVLIRKLAAAFHLGESLDLTIPVEAFQRAYEWMQPIEQRMKLGFSITGKNELNGPAAALLNALKLAGDNGIPEGSLYAHVMQDVGINQYKEIVEGLVVSGMIVRHNGTYIIKDETTM